MTIPIRNLYYLFCYAWERYPEGGEVEVGVDECPDLPNLFARILVNGLNRLLRRGVDRGYVPFEEELRAPRGRMLIDQSLKALTLERGAIECRLDELRHDVLHNQLLKATAALLARDPRVAPALAHQLREIVKRLWDVADIRVSVGLFSRVQLSRNTGQYRRLLRLCEFVWRAAMPEEGGDGHRFGDILRDEARMSQVFETFLLNFYRSHADGYGADPEDMRWRIETLPGSDASLLPIMRTDMTLRAAHEALVIDAKFYADPFPKGLGAAKIRSAHLYQLYAYLRHALHRHAPLPVRGALIYAAPNGGVAHHYRLDGHDITVMAVDLSQPWPQIHADLLSLVRTPADTSDATPQY